MTTRFALLLAAAGTLAALPSSVPAQTLNTHGWTGTTPPAMLHADPRFGAMLRWLEHHHRMPGMPFPHLPRADDAPAIPLPPVEGAPDVDTVQPLPPAALPWLNFALGMTAVPRAPVDADQDGTVSAEEAAAHAETIFVALDTDRDGSLSEQEFVRMGAVPFPGFTELENSERSSRFATLDGNADGRVSKAEFLDVGRAHYEAARDTLTGEVTPWSYRRSDWY